MPDARLVLQRDEDSSIRGTVHPIAVRQNGDVLRSPTSIGRWTVLKGEIWITLYHDLDRIVHEVATSKAVTAELRQSVKDAKGKEWPKHIEYDPVTKRFREYEVRPDKV